MKRIWIAAIAGMFIITIAGIAGAADMTQGMAMEGMDQTGHEGNTIHSSDVEGFHMIYQLFELKAAGQGAQPAQHLMVNITDQSGQPVENAKVGYFVTGPDGKEQKVMTMGMGGGYGANLDLSVSGDYVIKTKAVAGDKKVIDEFVYKVED